MEVIVCRQIVGSHGPLEEINRSHWMLLGLVVVEGYDGEFDVVGLCEIADDVVLDAAVIGNDFGGISGAVDGYSFGGDFGD